MCIPDVRRDLRRTYDSRWVVYSKPCPGLLRGLLDIPVRFLALVARSVLMWGGARSWARMAASLLVSHVQSGAGHSLAQAAFFQEVLFQPADLLVE